MSIASRIRALRLGRRMTIKAIATQTGVPASSYRDWEYGRKVIMNRLHVRNYFYESAFYRIKGKALKLTFAF